MFMSYFKILNNAKLILNNKACVLATYNTANIKHYNHPATTCIAQATLSPGVSDPDLRSHLPGW